MKQFEHGGNFPDEILDFSVNINPLGMPESVKKILAGNIGRFSEYPDPNCVELVQTLSEYEKIQPDNIVCGNGAADLIYRLVHALKPHRALLTSPTFSEYEKALTEADCQIKFHALRETENFCITERILDDLHDIDVFFLCDPNNPTGSLVSCKLMEKIIHRCVEENILLVVDQCFMEFTGRSNGNPALLNEHTVILKAFTKIYAMAGLRLGYMISNNTKLLEKVRNTGQCWSVSVPAQLAGISALQESEYIKKTVSFIRQERDYMCRSLKRPEIKIYPSETNYLFMHCTLPFDKLLLQKKIAVRSCKNYRGLNDSYFRIAVKNHDDNERLVNAVNEITE